MYSAGDLIVYGNTGVCSVQEIVVKEIAGTGELKDFYILKPLYQRCVISVPVDSTKIFMRPILTKDEAHELIDSIPGIKAEAVQERGVRQLTEKYEEQIKSRTCLGLAELVMSIYEKRRVFLAMNKKLGAVDERYMRRTEELLFGELAAALSIARDEVRDYIRARTGFEMCSD